MDDKARSEGKLLYGIYDSTCVIKAVGSITYHIGVSFDTFINRLLADNAIDNFLIDLTEADYIDSTNLGLLARIQVFARSKFSRRPTLITSNDTINGILGGLGFDRLFNILETSSDTSPRLSEMPAQPNQQDAMQDVLLSAHRYLMNTNTKNAVTFKNVVEMFEQDAHNRSEPN